MGGARIEFDPNGAFPSLSDDLKKLADKDFYKLLKVIGVKLVSSTTQRFDKEISPKGEPWKPSRRAKEEGGKTLTDTAGLKNSIRSEVTDDGVEIFTNKIYAKTHQRGVVITAKTDKGLCFFVGAKGDKHFVRVSQVVIPKREFLGISEDDIVTINTLLLKFISFKEGSVDSGN